MNFGFLVDLSGQQFDDGADVHWIQAMPVGTWEHPVHGTIEVTPERVQRFAANVNEGVRGQDLDIDYDHKEKSGEAAGWVKQAEARQDGLWLGVSWTRSALEKIKEKAYRYFSPEYVDTWKNPATSKTHTDVLFGGGLTNRPFLKGILPINLSEVLENNEGGKVDELRKELGLPDTATDAEVLAKVQELKGQSGGAGEGGGSGEGEGGTGTGSGEGGQGGQPAGEGGSGSGEGEGGAGGGEPVQASESTIIRLHDGTTKTLGEMLKEQATLTAAYRLSEVNQQITKLSDDKKVVAPAVIEKLRPLAVEMPKALSDRMFDVIGDLLGANGTIQLGEIGGGTRERTQDVVKRFSDTVDNIMKNNDKLSYADATEKAFREDPELYRQYREQVTGVTL